MFIPNYVYEYCGVSPGVIDATESWDDTFESNEDEFDLYLSIPIIPIPSINDGWNKLD